MILDHLLAAGVVPDPITRLGIRALLAKRLREEAAGGVEAQQARLMSFVEELRRSPLAVHTDAANEQHYEVPAEFYKLVLGPRLKYSSGYWPRAETTFAQSEEYMLALTCERAQLADGQEILELGCGWGSLTLFMAERYPHSRITAVSNSHSQRAFIEGEAARRGLSNVRIITADARQFTPSGTYDRIVSVEMFEHMRNYQELFARIATWLKHDGLLFVHIFAHTKFAYPFEDKGSDDWMARYFFTGGIMPSENLFHYFHDHLGLARQWRVSGTHYAKTSEAWLQNMDAHAERIGEIFKATYGRDAKKMFAYWRIFFMACAELWNYAGGEEWVVAHYLFQPRMMPVALSGSAAGSAVPDGLR
jgi:cyclopropane-fatty-acyl-phospholipid synthase